MVIFNYLSLIIKDVSSRKYMYKQELDWMVGYYKRYWPEAKEEDLKDSINKAVDIVFKEIKMEG